MTETSAMRVGRVHLLALCAGLVAVAEIVARAVPHWRHTSETIHSTIEGIVGTVAAVVGALLVMLSDYRPNPTSTRWISSSFIAMGCCDLFHACAESLQTFVGFRTMATFVGGMLMACSWLPSPPTATPLIALASATILATTFASIPDSFPRMVVGGSFTPIASALNLIGSVGFVAGMLRLGSARSNGIRRENELLGAICSMLAASGFSFPSSHIWSANWWLWHVFRLFAGIFAAIYLLHIYRSSAADTVAALHALQKTAAERDRANERLIATQRLSALGEVSAVVAHEIRNPLQVIANVSSLLATARDDDRSMLLAMVDGEVRRIQRIVSGILEFARPGERKLAEASIAIVVAEAVEAACTAAGASRSDVEVVTDDQASLECDAQLVRQAVINLVSNALSAPGRSAPVRVVLQLRDGIEVRVTDNGEGVPAEIRENLFAPFTSARAGGTGLGLYVVRHCATAHGGTVAYEDAPGGGASFVLRFPSRQAL